MERRRQPIAHQPRELRDRIHFPDFVQHPEQQLLAVGLVAEEPAIEPQLDRTAEPQRECRRPQPEEIAARIADELRDRQIAMTDDGVSQHDDGEHHRHLQHAPCQQVPQASPDHDPDIEDAMLDDGIRHANRDGDGGRVGEQLEPGANAPLPHGHDRVPDARRKRHTGRVGHPAHAPPLVVTGQAAILEWNDGEHGDHRGGEHPQTGDLLKLHESHVSSGFAGAARPDDPLEAEAGRHHGAARHIQQTERVPPDASRNGAAGEAAEKVIADDHMERGDEEAVTQKADFQKHMARRERREKRQPRHELVRPSEADEQSDRAPDETDQEMREPARRVLCSCRPGLRDEHRGGITERRNSDRRREPDEREKRLPSADLGRRRLDGRCPRDTLAGRARLERGRAGARVDGRVAKPRGPLVRGQQPLDLRAHGGVGGARLVEKRAP